MALSGGRLRIGVVGGSLGGLTTALLLQDLGHDVVIYERSPAELQERGAGIGFLPASYRYLDERVGIDPDRISLCTDHIRYLGRDGTVVHDEAHVYRFSSWNTVYRALLECFGQDRYCLGRELVAFHDTGETVRLSFTTGDTTEVDLLVCADGVGSTARASLLPDVRPRYAGYVAWRGTVPEAELDSSATKALGDAITYYVYANSHILVYPIPGPDGETSVGERLINFVWYRNYLAGDDLESVLTDRDGVRREVSVPPGAMAPVHVGEARAVATARLPPLLAHVVHATTRPFLQV
ncbi:MAG TPA: hypothetical protein VE152_00380, partial [Acidimicrobiales bacterium]|nr:hypothetical protein [Acidimicrobiales bacterium]